MILVRMSLALPSFSPQWNTFFALRRLYPVCDRDLRPLWALTFLSAEYIITLGGSEAGLMRPIRRNQCSCVSVWGVHVGCSSMFLDEVVEIVGVISRRTLDLSSVGRDVGICLYTRVGSWSTYLSFG